MIKQNPENTKPLDFAVEGLQKMIDEFDPTVYAVYSGWNMSSSPTIDEKLKSLETKKSNKDEKWLNLNISERLRP